MENTNKVKDKIQQVEQNENIFKTLINENNYNFLYYLSTLNLEKDLNTLVLSSIHHYYYDFNEIKKIKTLIQCKELNKISDIDKFFKNIINVLSPNSNFIGCFRDNKIYKDNILKRLKITDWLINKLHDKPNYYLSRKKVIKLLNNHDLKIIDITELDNITYFYVKK